MVHKPPLPQDFELPWQVNDWRHAPSSNKNGHVWRGENTERSVGVFSTFNDEVRVAVFDDRVTGFGRSIEPDRRGVKPNESIAEAIVWGIKRTVRWMDRHSASNWKHPAVNDAVFDPPPGYTLDRYYLEEREHIVYYRREEAPSGTSLTLENRANNLEPSVENQPYLVVKTFRGSGNSTVALAPWLRAHDHEMHDVVDTPDECGLDVALKLAREYACEQTGHEATGPATGQTGLSTFA